MDDLLFKRLERMNAAVEAEVVLQDLWFLDRTVRPLDGPRDDDYRAPFLAESLEARGFFSDTDALWAAIEMYDDLCDLCEVTSYAGLSRVLDRLRAYRRSHGDTRMDDR